MYAITPRRGMGAACNFVDDFGQCIAPLPGDKVTLTGSSYNRLVGEAGATFGSWINENITGVALVAGALFLLAIVKR